MKNASVSYFYELISEKKASSKNDNEPTTNSNEVMQQAIEECAVEFHNEKKNKKAQKRNRKLDEQARRK